MAIKKLQYTYKTLVFNTAVALAAPVLFPLLFCVALLARSLSRKGAGSQLRLMWGSAPIINNPYWARAMARAGYPSESFTENYAATLNARSDYDRLVTDVVSARIPLKIRALIAFVVSLFRYDIFFFSFEGGFLGVTPLWRLESFLLRVANKKVAVLCFGGDVFVYNRVRSISRLYGLVAYAAQGALKQRQIAKKVDYWVAHADCILPGFAYSDGLGRIDLLAYCVLCIDTGAWPPSSRLSQADGVNGVVKIAHAPNSRGGKGTRYILRAVKALQDEGLRVELMLLEGVKTEEVKRILTEEADVLAEQLVLLGYGLNGMEGMAAGLPVISNLDDEEYFGPLRRWSYFNECPVVSATPESITDVLRELVTRPELRHSLGHAGRQFVEKYHGNEATGFLFKAVIDYMNDDRSSLLEFCDPETGDFPKRLPTVRHPLVRNLIPKAVQGPQKTLNVG
jgi:glycosyltransferase involved in cell wall biosynthesis